MKIACRKKFLIIILITTFILFGIYNVVWFLNYRSYEKYVGTEFTVSKASAATVFYSANGFTYSVKKPSYPSLTGNISCANKELTVGIIAWPTFMCEQISAYGLAISDNTQNSGYLIYADENMNYLSDKDTGIPVDKIESVNELLAKLQPSIINTFEHMKLQFEL